MTTQKQYTEHESDNNATDKTLVHLDVDIPEVGEAKDINRKIDFLDGNLNELNAELESIKSSVEEGLDRLGDTEMDLTSKVSDTYKRLGELDKTYKSLIEISSNIDHEIQKLTGNITEVATHSTAELEKLEATAQVHNSYQSQQNQMLVERVNQLVTSSQQTTSDIQVSIQSVRETILVAEHKLVADIEILANSSKKDHEVLSKNLDVSNIEIQSSKARILKTEKVDEALVRRANQLEFSTNELTVKSEELDKSVKFLDDRTSNLSNSILAIVEHTDALRKESEKHSVQISGIRAKLFGLDNKVVKHFRVTLALIALTVIAGFWFYDYQTGENTIVALKAAEQAQVVDSELSGLNQQIQQEQIQSVKLNNEVEKLNDEVSALSTQLSVVNKSVKKLDDQAQSLDGRLTTVLPYDSFGGDNIIHGLEWLAGLPVDKFIIQFAVAPNKQEMYEIAHSYNRYLTEPVSYYADVNGNHVMFYGVFDSSASADAELQRMPYRVNRQRPVVRSVSSVQQLIAP